LKFSRSRLVASIGLVKLDMTKNSFSFYKSIQLEGYNSIFSIPHATGKNIN